MWEEIKEIYLFRCGWLIPLMMWILTLMMVGLLCMLVYMPFEVAAIKREMTQQHCVKTDEYEVRNGTVLMPIGKVTVPMPTTNRVYKYDCDDGIRWR